VAKRRSTIQQTSEGKDMSRTYNSASIWVKKVERDLRFSTPKLRPSKTKRFDKQMTITHGT